MYNNTISFLSFRDKCWLPSVTLTSYIQRELHPKAPLPIPHVHSEAALRSVMLKRAKNIWLLQFVTIYSKACPCSHLY